MDKKLKISLPTELLEMSEDKRREALQNIEKALKLSDEAGYETDEHGHAIRDVWEQNDESNYNELEERSFNELATATWKSMLELFEMLELDVPITPIENMEKAFFTDDENPIFIATEYLQIPDFKSSVDARKVATLKKAISDGSKLPPLVVGYHYDIQDGLHRLRAAQELGITHVPCVVGGMEPENVYAAENHYRGLWKSWNEANVKRDARGRFASQRNSLSTISEEAYKSTLENGGITISLKTGNKRRKGYAYAMNKDSEYKVPLEQFSQKDIIKYVKQHKDSLLKVKAHLGTWVSEDGFAYIDVSYVGPPEEDTIARAKEAQQIAVFDLANFEEIKTGWVEKAAKDEAGKKLVFLISTEGKTEDEIIKEAIEAVDRFNLVYGQAEEALKGEGDE